MTRNDKKWQEVTKNDKKWQEMTRIDKKLQKNEFTSVGAFATAHNQLGIVRNVGEWHGLVRGCLQDLLISGPGHISWRFANDIGLQLDHFSSRDSHVLQSVPFNLGRLESGPGLLESGRLARFAKAGLVFSVDSELIFFSLIQAGGCSFASNAFLPEIKTCFLLFFFPISNFSFLQILCNCWTQNCHNPK